MEEWWPSGWYRLGPWHHWGGIPSPPQGSSHHGKNGVTSFSTLVSLEPACGLAAVTQTWWLQNGPVSTCHGCTFACSPLVIASLWPYLGYLGSNHNLDHLRLGHGWYNQKQHILYCSFWSLGSGGWPPQIWGMRWQNALSSQVPITDPGAGSAVQDPLQNWELTLETRAPESISVVIFYPSSYHWSLIRTSHYSEQRGQGWGAGTGVNLWSSFLLSCFQYGQF